MKHGNPYNAAAAVLDAIRRIVQVLRVSDRSAEREVGVSAAQLFVLEKLAAAGKPLSVNELAARTLTHQSSVSVVVQKLENARLVSRSRSKRDARRVELSLTSRAHRLLRMAPPAAQERILGAVSAMSLADQARLAELLGTLARQVAGDGAPAMFFEDAERTPSRAAAAARRTRRARA